MKAGQQFILQSLEHEFDDTSDMAAAMALPAVRRYLAQDHGGDHMDLGFRALVEHPEALSRSFRGQLQ
jgi:hypothetical protein